MTAVAFRERIDLDRHRSALVTGLVLSLLLHLGIAVLLLRSSWATHEAPPPEFVMEVVQLPKPAPKPVPPPEPPPEVQQTPPPPVAAMPPPPPQLTEAPIAEKAAPPPHESPSHAPPRQHPAAPKAEPKREAAVAPPLPVNSSHPDSAPVTVAPREKAKAREPSGRSEEPATQTVPDYILMQIAQHWIIDVHGPRYRDIVLRGAQIVLLPDGMLAPPFGKNDPWNPRAMISNYDALLVPGAEPIKTAVETFLQAMRQAQPFRLPPDGKPDDKPRVLTIYFRLGDIPQGR